LYQIEAWSALRNFWRSKRRDKRGSRGVNKNVVALGVTSMLTDISSEMVTTVLPIFLVVHLGLTPLHLGIVEGLYQGITALLRVIAGAAADRLRRFKEIAVIGYGLSAMSRLVMVFASAGSFPLIVSAVAGDRLGKGIRVIPRDLIISLSSTPSRMATAFGVHRAFDSAGAMLGPIVALGILALAPTGFDIVFVISFCFAICGVATLWLFVGKVGDSERAPPPSLPVFTAFRQVTRVVGLPALTAAATLLGLATVSDGLIYLLLQQQAGFNAGLLPLLFIGTSFCYFILAVPAGRLADRIGHCRGFLAGYAMLLGCYAVVVAFVNSWLGPVVGVGLAILLLGAYYALTDGVLMALASGLLPEQIRGSGLAWLTTLTSLGRAAAAVVFGAIWTFQGAIPALVAAISAVLVALVIAIIAMRRIPTPQHNEVIP